MEMFDFPNTKTVLKALEGHKHKHNCFAVLVDNDNYDRGLHELNQWIKHLEAQGELELVTFSTGATGLQAIVTGATGTAFKFIDNNTDNNTGE